MHFLTSWRIFTGEIDFIYDIRYSSVAAGLLTGCRHDNAVHIGEFLTKLCPVEIAFNFYLLKLKENYALVVHRET